LEYLALILVIYILTNLIATIHYAVGLIEDELFEDGLQIHHIIFFPSLVVVFVAVVFIMIVAIIVEFIFKIFTFKLG
jgi:hypothetical protein